MTIQSFYFKEPVINFRKHTVNDKDGKPIVTVIPKVSFFPKYYFYSSKSKNELIFYAVLKNSKELIKNEFIIYNPQNEKVVVVKDRPIYQMTQLFKEFIVLYNDNQFDVKFTPASKQFNIYNSDKELIVTGKRVSSFLSHIMERRNFKIDIKKETDVNIFLWIIIVKGMTELM